MATCGLVLSLRHGLSPVESRSRISGTPPPAWLSAGTGNLRQLRLFVVLRTATVRHAEVAVTRRRCRLGFEWIVCECGGLGWVPAKKPGALMTATE